MHTCLSVVERHVLNITNIHAFSGNLSTVTKFRTQKDEKADRRNYKYFELKKVKVLL